MATPGDYRWRKVSDVNREYALFELLDGEVPVLDVGFNDEAIFEIAFDEAIVGRVIEWDRLATLIQEGRALADQDRL